MLQLNDLAVATLPAHKHRSSISNGLNRRTRRSGVIDPFVGSNTVENRMLPREAEARTDAGEINGRAQKSLSHRLTLVGEVASYTVLIVVINRPQAFTAIYKFCRENFTVGDFLPVLVKLFINHAELISALKIAQEINVPSEDVYELHNCSIGEPRFLAIDKQRVVDLGDC